MPRRFQSRSLISLGTSAAAVGAAVLDAAKWHSGPLGNADLNAKIVLIQLCIYTCIVWLRRLLCANARGAGLCKGIKAHVARFEASHISMVSHPVSATSIYRDTNPEYFTVCPPAANRPFLAGGARCGPLLQRAPLRNCFSSETSLTA
jgi:hypothetical protein